MSRFAPGERSGCTVTFSASREPIAAAAVADVMAFTVFPTGTVPREAWLRVRPAGSTCFDPTPPVLLRAYPNFKTLPSEPGGARWSMSAFDINAAGKPVHIRTIEGSGAPALDAASRSAVARSRFEAKARQGCLYPYWQRGSNLAAPEGPTPASLRPTDATCRLTLILPAAPGRRSPG